MSQTKTGPQQLQIGNFVINLLSDSAITRIGAFDSAGNKRIVSHQVSNTVLSLIQIEYIGLYNDININDYVDIFLKEYELESDDDDQLHIPKGVVTESIHFTKFIGALKDPSYCGIIIRDTDALVVIFMIRGLGMLSPEFQEEFRSCIAISRA